MDEVEKLKARLTLLEDALHQAQWTVAFLHNCLVKPANGQMNGGYTYAYPEHTLEHLRRWKKLAHPPTLCHHSMFKPDCPRCVESREWRKKKAEAERLLGEK